MLFIKYIENNSDCKIVVENWLFMLVVLCFYFVCSYDDILLMIKVVGFLYVLVLLFDF